MQILVVKHSPIPTTRGRYKSAWAIIGWDLDSPVIQRWVMPQVLVEGEYESLESACRKPMFKELTKYSGTKEYLLALWKWENDQWVPVDLCLEPLEREDLMWHRAWRREREKEKEVKNL